ncbi:MAG: universal stress protein [Hyphomicrobiaceae bacterium]
MYTNILLTTDGSELATRSVEQGIGLAKALGANTTVLTVIQPLHTVAPAEAMIAFPAAEYDKHAQQNADKILQRAKEAADMAEIACTTKSVTHDAPWQAIVDTAADTGCDLIVMGSHGRTGLSKLVIGSETQKVLAHTTIPVLVTR